MKVKNLYRSLMLQIILLFAFCVNTFELIAQTPNQVINTVTQRFAKVNDYTADINVACNITFIKIEPINAKVFYKRPDKFKVKSTGILVLPKQNANFYIATLSDTNNYTAVKTGEEMINNVKTQIINVIPASDTSDLVLGKFWIDDEHGLVLKSQLTTKSQGTILVENTYGIMSTYALPDKMLFTVDIGKFKIPKMLSVDINRSSSDKTTESDNKGRITLTFSNYVVNKGVSTEVFK